MSAKRIGILTGGGDAPGLNGVIESCGRTLLKQGYEVIGICDGFQGMFEGRTRSLTLPDVVGLHGQAGTILGSSNKMATAGREEEFLRKYEELRLEGLVVAGGDGTFAGLTKMGQRLKLIGIPKTIDNDLQGTDFTFGYDTACTVVAESVDALRASANAHSRCIVVETMGRTAGWIALGGGLASYADAILLPERPFSKPALADFLRGRKATQRGALIVASEGAAAQGENVKVQFTVAGSPQAERYGGIAQALARWVEAETNWESRHVVLGHLQRAGHPTTTDKFLTLSMGVEAARMAIEGAWGQAVVLRQAEVVRAPLADLMKPARLVPHDHRWLQLAQAMGAFI
jgi:6-phosphofructokinase 1